MYLCKSLNIFIATIIVAFGLIAVTTKNAYSGTFAVDRITNNAVSDDVPQINDNGEVVWVESGQIFRFDGTSITQVSNNTFGNNRPQINNNGQIVWDGTNTPGGDSQDSTREIFLFDGTTIIQLTNNSVQDVSPQINGNGEVVWLDRSRNIFFYDGTSVTQLTSNGDNEQVKISNNGYIVWVREQAGTNASEEIFLYDGNAITQLTNNLVQDSQPQINSSGIAVWNGNGDIFLFDGSSTVLLSTTSFENSSPQINDNTEVVWSGVLSPGGANTEIFLHTGTSVVQITNTSAAFTDEFPKINSNGEIAWLRVGPSISVQEIFHYDGISVTQLSNNSSSNKDQQISNGGVVWAGIAPGVINFEIFLATFQEDTDDDGVSNDEDLCSDTPPGVVVDANGCSDAQVDGDGDGVCDPNAPSAGPSACIGSDVCDGTVIPESVPTVELKPNHWALTDDDFNFDTVSKDKGNGPGRSYTTADTAGCSCGQIIEAQGLGQGHVKHGCSISAMDDWVALVNP